MLSLVQVVGVLWGANIWYYNYSVIVSLGTIGDSLRLCAVDSAHLNDTGIGAISYCFQN